MVKWLCFLSSAVKQASCNLFSILRPFNQGSFHYSTEWVKRVGQPKLTDVVFVGDPVQSGSSMGGWETSRDGGGGGGTS